MRRTKRKENPTVLFDSATTRCPCVVQCNCHALDSGEKGIERADVCHISLSVQIVDVELQPPHVATVGGAKDLPTKQEMEQLCAFQFSDQHSGPHGSHQQRTVASLVYKPKRLWRRGVRSRRTCRPRSPRHSAVPPHVRPSPGPPQTP